MRTLHITRNFPPMIGGMERLNRHIAEQLGLRGQTHLLAGAGARAEALEGVEVTEIPMGSLSRFLLQSAIHARRIAGSWRPDVVLAGSGLFAPQALWAAQACGALSAVYVHGLDIAVPHPVYRALWWPALRRVRRVIANSASTAELARRIGIADERIRVVHPGVSMVGSTPGAAQAFRRRHELEDRTLLLSVGRLTRRKGLLEFVSDALPRIVAARPDATLVVVGGEPAQALFHKGVSIETIRQAAAAAGVETHLRFLGRLDDEELIAACLASQVHVFPVLDIPQDPEGFGMVAVEAAAQGLATVAYASAGVVDAVRDGVSGRLVKPGDSEAFAAAVLEMLQAPPDAGGIRGFAADFAWPRFGERLLDALAES